MKGKRYEIEMLMGGCPVATCSAFGLEGDMQEKVAFWIMRGREPICNRKDRCYNRIH